MDFTSFTGCITCSFENMIECDYGYVCIGGYILNDTNDGCNPCGAGIKTCTIST